MKDSTVIAGYVAGLVVTVVIFFWTVIYVTIETERFMRTLWLS